MKTELDGAFLVPETAYIEVKRKGMIFAATRVLGGLIIRAGLWVCAFGFRRIELYRQKSLWEAVLERRRN